MDTEKRTWISQYFKKISAELGLRPRREYCLNGAGTSERHNEAGLGMKQKCQKMQLAITPRAGGGDNKKNNNHGKEKVPLSSSITVSFKHLLLGANKEPQDKWEM